MQPANLLHEFRNEASDHLAVLDAELLKLERTPSDAELVRRMFLAAHSIKGGAAMLGLNEIRDLAHAMEEILAHLRDQKAALRTDTADLLFQSVDALRRLTGAPDGNRDSTADTAYLAERLRGHLAEATATRPEQSPAATKTASTGPRALLVENSPTVRALEAMILSDAGYQVDVLQEGGEALERARAERYRLVVSGMETAGLRGIDLAAALREDARTHELAIAVLTNEDAPADRQRATALGVHYIRRDKAGNQRLREIAKMVQQVAS
jgi:chemotaxis protein histidine kinase CheA